MNNGVKKAICIASTVTMCGLYTLPIYAINEKDTMYCKANNIGVVYKETSNGEEKNEDKRSGTKNGWLDRRKACLQNRFC